MENARKGWNMMDYSTNGRNTWREIVARAGCNLWAVSLCDVGQWVWRVWRVRRVRRTHLVGFFRSTFQGIFSKDFPKTCGPCAITEICIISQTAPAIITSSSGSSSSTPRPLKLWLHSCTKAQSSWRSVSFYLSSMAGRVCVCECVQVDDDGQSPCSRRWNRKDT